MLLAFEEELVIMDVDGIDELRCLVAQGDEEDLHVLQFIGNHPPMDAILVAASTGGE